MNEQYCFEPNIRPNFYFVKFDVLIYSVICFFAFSVLWSNIYGPMVFIYSVIQFWSNIPVSANVVHDLNSRILMSPQSLLFRCLLFRSFFYFYLKGQLAGQTNHSDKSWPLTTILLDNPQSRLALLLQPINLFYPVFKQGSLEGWSLSYAVS